MTRQIDTKTPNRIATEPATVEACQRDRKGRDDALQAAIAAVQKGLAGTPGGFTATGGAR
ncbi:hypothetical protein ACFYOF_20470 [Streptomyces sp. NPDC007148]|uniref:hypothetical protein n=1 Tax=Streptomyces sp. NPDC007148 TaxID=3364775 RepID=UPI00368427BC